MANLLLNLVKTTMVITENMQMEHWKCGERVTQ